MRDGGVDGLFDAAADRGWVATGDDLADAFLEDGAGQNGCGRRAVAGDIGRFRRDFVHELGAHVFEAVFEFDFLAHGHAVFGDGRAAERFVDDDVAAGGAHRNSDGVRQFLDALKHPSASGVVEE